MKETTESLRNSPTFYPHPGISIIKLLDRDHAESLVSSLKRNATQLLRGEIFVMGPPLLTDFNAIIQAENYGEVGDIIYFLSYEGGYDELVIEGVKYKAVKWADFRTKVII
jgi:hypothetical protein